MSTASFQSILTTFRKYSFSERDKGYKFERLMQAYLQTDPKYAHLFSNVWLWNDFPFRKDFGGQDTGIDLVAKTTHGDYWAVQCKCWSEDSYLDKADVDSFLSTSGRMFVNDDGHMIGFTQRLWISTTNKWGENARKAIENQNPPVTRINLYDLEQAPVDWENLEKGLYGETSRTPQKKLFPHQTDAVEKAHRYFQTAERGKLIMACGTGKTYTALKIAEKETNNKGLILFLVPSIALLGQTLREWSAEAQLPIEPICICSDANVSQKQTKNEDSDGFSIIDLAMPASTNVNDIVRQFRYFQQHTTDGMTVVFSTYQSIEVIARAQTELLKGQSSDAPFGIFDMIICDEAHRTTGVTIAGDDESSFVKVHDNNFLKAKKRLYMTATPRLYSDDSKAKAAKADAILASMDDAALYGEEIYRIGFGKAVEDGLLSDYKVLILTLSDSDVPPAVQKMIAGEESEINSDDASKLIGCINALSKQVLGDEGILKSSDPEPMRRAVAFCQSIKISKRITASFNDTRGAYLDSLPEEKRAEMVDVVSDHIDGTMSAPARDEKLGWLKAQTQNARECRILTNVRCLSEGVDVPSLDAVLFLSARNSQVDVVQSVGRVMRKAPGKKYGYIIIPVIVPSDVEPDKALDDNERYKVVWTVLNALRAHDDRFNATINKIELNQKRPEQILVARPDGYSDADSGSAAAATAQTQRAFDDAKLQLSLQFQQLQSIVFARMVQKVGDRRYWEQWAKDVAAIAERYVGRIGRLVRAEGEHREAFDSFLGGLQKNINPSITQAEAIEMLAQHIITKPVFEALFEGYSFVKNNPISVSMQTMLDVLHDQSFDKDAESLARFYESVKSRAAGIDNATGKQRIIIELYDKFFKTAFPKMVEKLGIVYTPVEVVDFIIHSADALLKKEFGRSLTDENIHILDPFTGTGTFITRLLQSGLIAPEDLERKYTRELYANEIVLLAYYIAAINIENAYHDQTPTAPYRAFEGICLTDTFQLAESDDGDKLFSAMFPQNSERVQRQKNAPLRVILGNPPYSVGQKDYHDMAQNQEYPKLDARIEKTYAAGTTSMKRAVYDAYIKAFRWSSDRLDKNGGIISFVSNGSWIDGQATDGFRKCLEQEFSAIYVFNLRGNQRTSGELSRKEGGKIFGSGSRTPIAITFLIKNPNNLLSTGEGQGVRSKAVIHYHDIGDYLNREEKLRIVQKFGSVENPEMQWQPLEPNEHGDWLNQRNDLFETFFELGDKKESRNVLFEKYSAGVITNRESWVYCFSTNQLVSQVKSMIDFYNKEVEKYGALIKQHSDFKIDSVISKDPKKIKWDQGLMDDAIKLRQIEFEVDSVRIGLYRPFFKQRLYFNKNLNWSRYQLPSIFPKPNSTNVLICISGSGGTKDFSCVITDCIPDRQMQFNGQCFPLYYYEERIKTETTLFDGGQEQTEYVRRDGISDWILERAQRQYGGNVSKEDIFYYVYGFLHSPDYRAAFANDLKKMLPRLPLVDAPNDFWRFSKAGRKLAELHINYETAASIAEPPAGVVVRYAPGATVNYHVEKMRFSSKTDKSAIHYNSQITITDIPPAAYDYVVNGKSAIEWVMERYQITTHKESGIRNDPNDWAAETGNPHYILDLLLSVIRVSIETMEIVRGLPAVKF